ncbi:MAG: isoamylase early set domain-containing protein [Candidatus Omnitrophica bacterium]|nr:isoamylase early set domain-containing protein [Candidatus Omnitrophota bacterium]
MQLKQLVKSKSPKTSTQKISFEYHAPSAQTAFLAGTFNNWSQETLPLKKDKDGRWTTTLPLAPGRYEYLYFVDGAWQCDPKSKECVPNPFGSWNCVVNVQ